MATASPLSVPFPPHDTETGDAYDAVGSDYRRYADGDLENLFDFSSRYGFADHEIWQRIDAILVDTRARGRRAIRIIDAGCGPGTWLIRTVLRAQALGFDDIAAHGFDISRAMIDLAQQAAADLPAQGVRIDFDIRDIEDGVHMHHDAPADLVLCLYGVLNHLPVERHRDVAKALSQASAGSLLVTVRMVGSLPSIFVTGLEAARDFRRDHRQDRIAIEMRDGRHIEFNSHLFMADELRALFLPSGEIVELTGLDLFHGRFAPDNRWNPPIAADREFDEALARLEHLCAGDTRFIDRAAHALLHLNLARREP